jgi:PAS domain S-box-containing protein
MLEMFGVTYEEALQAQADDFSLGEYPCNAEEAKEKFRRTVQEGPQTFEWLSRKKNGELFWTEVGLKLTEFAKRSYIIAVVRNIDEKKKAEQVLRAEQERLAVTLRSIGDGVITTDTKGHIVLLNEVAEDLTGWISEEAHGRPSSEVFIIKNEKTGDPCESPIDKCLRTGKVVGFGGNIELVARDGARRSIADSGAPIRDREGAIIGVVLVFRDITNEKKMEKELLKIRKLESVGVLAGGIAHDFNNILTAILGNIELAARLAGDREKVLPLLDDALKASLRAEKLTNQLLTFAKGGEPIREAASLDELIRDSADFVLRGSNVSCRYEIPEDLWLAKVDKGQMSQVIQNIIINARQAMPDGGIISISCSNVDDASIERLPGTLQGKFVKIEVRDTGTGIPQDIVDKVFDPFFSTREKGSGLGLAICHSIIDKHGGRIGVESTPGAGTVFTLYLPASVGIDSQSGAGDPGEYFFKSVRIMVMDDEELFIKVVRSQLEYLGHKVVFAADGLEAIEQYQKRLHTDQRFDVVIMDLTIPGGMGGREAVQRILEIDPEARVIVSSGYSNDPVMANYTKYGFSAAVVKPFKLKELQGAITMVLSQA